MLSVSAVRDSATTSKSENLGTGPRCGTLPDSLTKVIFLSDYIDIIIEKSPKKHQNTEKAKTNSIRLKLFFNFVAETS